MNEMTIKQFSEMTGISSPALRRLSVCGKLIPVSVTSGGHRRYSESQIDDAKQFVHRMKLLTDGRNIVDESIKLDPFFAYLLGLVIADGSVSKNGQVQLEMKDEQIIVDVAAKVGAEVGNRIRENGIMYRITIPRKLGFQLIEYGVCRCKGKGFDVPEMCEESFGHFIRGLFDGDGSVSIRGGHRRTFRIHGHPRAMAFIQATFLENYGLYLPWVADNRLESGMLETSRKAVVDIIYGIMYNAGEVFLKRKRESLTVKTGGISYGYGIDAVPSHPV
jgi:hypothetical protein